MILFTLSNVLQYISFLTPIILITFPIISSFFVGDILSGIPLIKNMIYIFGLLLNVAITVYFQNKLQVKQSKFANPICKTLPYPFTNQKVLNEFLVSPYTNSSLLGFTFGYVFLSIVFNKSVYISENVNYLSISLFVLLVVINCVSDYINRCSKLSGIILGLLLGVINGYIYYTIISAMDRKQELTFHSEIIDNGKHCKSRGDKIYKCDYYYNGEILSDRLDIFK